jgi:hypothetical protein
VIVLKAGLFLIERVWRPLHQESPSAFCILWRFSRCA